MAYIGQLQYNINLGNGTIITTDGLDLKESKSLIDIMKVISGATGDNIFITKLGIQAPPGSLWVINEEGDEADDKEIYIGSTGIYEVENVKLNDLKYIPQKLYQQDETAQYIALDNAINSFQSAENTREKELETIEKIEEDNVETYIDAQRKFYESFLNAVNSYEQAFNGMYWSEGIQNPQNIIIDFVLDVR